MSTLAIIAIIIASIIAAPFVFHIVFMVVAITFDIFLSIINNENFMDF